MAASGTWAAGLPILALLTKEVFNLESSACTLT
jgi:hypothetical protein